MIIRKRNIVKGNFPRKQEFLQGVKDCISLAQAEYPEFKLNYSGIPVVFFPKGTTAGYAKWKKVNGVRHFNLEFNVSAIEIDWNDMYLDTIPHEVAHIVTRFLHGSNARSHGTEWVRIANKLGCSGERCHSLILPKARKRTCRARRPRQLYISDGGSECILGPNQHNQLQRDNNYRVKITRTGEELFPHNHVRAA